MSCSKNNNHSFLLSPCLPVSLFITSCAILVAAGGCGHAPLSTAEQPQPIAAPAVEAPRDDGIAISGTLGTVAEEKVEDTFARRRGEIDLCFKRAAADQPWLGGTLAVKVRIGSKGEVEDAFLVDALGSAEVERCVLGVVRATTFSPPEGGNTAEFNWSIELRGTMSTEPWGNEQVARPFATNRKALDRCARPGVAGVAPRALRVVFYVAPGGVVPAASAAADEPIGDAYRDCLVAEVRKWKFPDPRGKVARVTYRF